MLPASDSLRTVLMVCYHFPPVSAAGTQRNVGFARALPHCGWKPIVLTVKQSKNTFERSGEPDPETIDVFRTLEWDLYRVLMFATGVWNRLFDVLGLKRRKSVFFEWCLPDPQIAWFTTIRTILLSRKADCVYVSCAPFSAAVSACLAQKVTGIPVVLDFRDAWALNPHAGHGAAQRRIIRRLEAWVLRACDCLILNTPGALRLYRTSYPEYAAKMTCIPNGFDRLNVPDSTRKVRKFTIMHVGDFYRSRTPERLLRALANIKNDDIEFVQVGPVFDGLAQFKDVVNIRLIDRVTHREALDLMRTASLLYLCQGWETGVTEYIAVASKTYEYLATGLPILADCPPGDNADVVREFASKAWVVASRDVGLIESAVREAYDGRENLKPCVTPAFTKRFQREHLAFALAGALNRAVSGDHSTASVSLPSNSRTL
jgi:hypothetical protein